MENKRNISEELKEIDDKIALALDLQQYYGEDYQRKLSELEEEYHRNIITTNRGIVEQHIRRNALLEKKNYIVTARYLNAMDVEYDTDAFWLAPSDPAIGQNVRLFDNIVHGIGERDGVIVDIYEKPEGSGEYKTIAVPYHYKPFWSVNYQREDEKE